MVEPRRSAQILDARTEGARLLIAEARFYDRVADLLLEGATDVCRVAKTHFDIVTMPGALELGTAIAIACDGAKRRGRPYDGAIALGCVIRGETYHFEIVSQESARSLSELGLREMLPIGNGVLTVEDEAQALVRADPLQGDKGGDAARAALALIGLQRRASLS